MIGTAQQIIGWLFNYSGEPDKRFEIKVHKNKRSLSQNSYYWVLLGKMSVKTGISTARIHNTNLRHIGLVERIDTSLVTLLLPDTDEAEQGVIESTTYHAKPTGKTVTGHDKRVYRQYVMLRGSHTFNTEEMGSLLDLAIQDAEAIGIETMTPAELARIREHEKQAEQGNRHHVQGKADRMGA